MTFKEAQVLALSRFGRMYLDDKEVTPMHDGSFLLHADGAMSPWHPDEEDLDSEEWSCPTRQLSL